MPRNHWLFDIADALGLGAIFALVVWTSCQIAVGVMQGDPPSPGQQREASLGEVETYCTKLETRNDCIIQLRTASATERQANIASAGLVLVLATTGLTAMAAFAAFWTVWTMKTSEKRELRAYVGIVDVKIEKLGVGEKMRLRANIKNFGRTPAYKVTHWAEIKIAPRDETDFPFEEGTSGMRVMNPDNSFGVSSQHTVDLSQDDWDRLSADTARIFYWGRIGFVDIYKRPHYSTFRMEYGGPHTMAIRAFEFSKQGNDADY